MARRLIATKERVKIYRDPEWNEYHVVPRKGSAIWVDANTYFCTDKAEAFDQADYMEQHMKDEGTY